MKQWIAIVALVLCAYPQSLAQDQPEDTVRSITIRSVPVYPELARRLGLEGNVKLRVTVTPSGTASASEVLGGNPVLAKAAQDAVMHWKWAPASRESKETVELRFQPR